MKKFAFTLVFLMLTVPFSSAQTPFPQATPESQGVSSVSILEFVNHAEAEIDALHSLMILRHGHLVAQGWWEPYDAQSPHMLFSLSKSFTSTAIGMAISEGILSLDDTVISFFPNETPDTPSDNLKAMRIRDLLAMNSGHQEDTSDDFFKHPGQSWVKTFLSLEVEHKPGTHFVYNSGATYMLSAILQKATGKTLIDFLTPRLFEPLQITNPTWESDPQGINIGGWGLKVRTEDIAKLGQLYLQKGQWQGKQLIPESWVEMATSRQTSNGSNPQSDWEQGYGYQFWRCRHNIYRGDGAFGQYCIVMPDQDAVVAITSGVPDMQAVLNLVWDYLLPGIHQGVLPEDADIQKNLADKLAGLCIKFPEGASKSPMAAAISGQSFEFETNEAGFQSVKIDVSEDRYVITFKNKYGVHSFNCGLGAWEKGQTILEQSEPQPVAASGAWESPDHFVVKLCYYETPFCPRLDFNFAGGKLNFSMKANVTFGTENPVVLTGQVKK